MNLFIFDSSTLTANATNKVIHFILKTTPTNTHMDTQTHTHMNVFQLETENVI